MPDRSDDESSSSDEEDCGWKLTRRYVQLPGCHLCVAELMTLPGSSATGDGSGGIVRGASEELARWCGSHGRDRVAGFSSALELGAGVGLLSVALAKLGIPRVVATDGEPQLCKLIAKNASRNGVRRSQLSARRFLWGDKAALEEVLRDVASSGGRSSRCAELVLASDVLYSTDASHFDLLEATLRSLLSRGGCRLVLICWHVRNCNEEAFLPRLRDCGAVSTVWRSHGLRCDDRCPTGEGSEEAVARWRAAHTGTWAIAALEPRVGVVSTKNSSASAHVSPLII